MLLSVDEPLPILLENLVKRRAEKLEAERRYRAQLKACAEAGYPVAQLAKVLGLARQTVHRSLASLGVRR